MDEREGLASALASAKHQQTLAVIRWSHDTNPATDRTPPRLVDQQIAAILSSDWLTAHDREVAALALEAAAVEVRAEIGQAETSLHGVSHESEIPFPTDMVLRGASLMVERILARVATMRATPSTGTRTESETEHD